MKHEIEAKNDFPTFWAIYPRKAGKVPAEKAFNKLSDVDKFNCIQGVRYQIEHNPQWKDPTYIPLPATFLNQKRWQDEIVQGKDAKTRVVESSGDSPAHTVWATMTDMFGEAWIKKHGEKPTQIWVSMLNAIPVDRIKRGLRRTYESGTDFPPSLPKFAEYCSRTFDEIYPTALPKPPGNKKLALESLAEMRKNLRESK